MTPSDTISADRDFHALIAALKQPDAYAHLVAEVGHVETHISHVLLAGPFAYKLKKPVDLGFVDFSTPERRRYFCDEELRLNRRLAPQLYLDVVAITGDDRTVRVGGRGAAIEHAVRMRRFPQGALLSRQRLDAGICDRLADRIAAFHQGLPPGAADEPRGAQDAVLAPMLKNFTMIRSHVNAPEVLQAVGRLERWTRGRAAALAERLAERRRGGFIRECHGDMHRGNIVLLDGEPVIFDCIECNPDLRCIDTMSELAFLVMDLQEAGETALSRRVLNRYMERTGDYDGLAVLRFYQVYRAMVRAKVLAIRLGQADASGEERDQLQHELRRYLRIARRSCLRKRPRLFITHGLSGSGKTRLGDLLRAHLPVIQVRSDVERKRLFGLEPRQRPDARLSQRLYDADTTQRTYRRLLDAARLILNSGYSVLVDATFLKRAQRAMFLALGQELGRPCRILALEAPLDVLQARLGERARADSDASDADSDTLDLQLAQRESFSDDEMAHVVRLDGTRQHESEAEIARLVEEAR